MKKRISFNLFITVLGRGISQAFHAAARIAGSSAFIKVFWHLIVACFAIWVTILTIFGVYAFATDVVRDKWCRTDDSFDQKFLSNHIAFRQKWDSKNGKIYNLQEDRVVMRKVDWVITSPDRDSLAVFAKNGKRGYLNRFSGKVAISPTYTRAWVFSEGLAAVEMDGKLRFIDHSGKVVIDRNFEVPSNVPDHVFKHGYCVVQDSKSGKKGLIDRNGEWALEPEYDNILNENGFWNVRIDDLCGLYSEELEPLFPVENTNISIGHGTIEVRHPDHIARRYDFEGNLLVDFVIDEVESMMYETTEFRTDEAVCEDTYAEEIAQGIANALRYTVYSGSWEYPDYCGLLSRDGRRLTPPVYTSIEAIARDRYICQPDGIIIDDRGIPVEQNR